MWYAHPVRCAAMQGGAECRVSWAVGEKPRACRCMCMHSRACSLSVIAAAFGVSGQQSGTVLLDGSQRVPQPGDFALPSVKCYVKAAGGPGCCARACRLRSAQRSVLCPKRSHLKPGCLRIRFADVEAVARLGELSSCRSGLIGGSTCVCTCGSTSMGAGCTCAARA